jgi:hypothetical protein
MTRREVLIQIGSLLLFVPAGTLFVGCGDDGDDGGGANDALTFTSTVVQAHSHTVTIQMMELTGPPAGGVTRNTSVDAGHLHAVTLTQADLNAIDAGEVVPKETTLVDAHTHAFEFRRA